MSEKIYVVIGASAAGIAAVQKIRQLDQTARIICISDEQEMPYNKCFLADFLNGHKTLAEIHTKSQSFFKQHDITLLLDTKVIQIDRAQKQLQCADGSIIDYTSLLIATGGSVRIPAFLDQTVHSTFQSQSSNQAPLPLGVFFLHTLADTLALHAWLSKESVARAIVMGAGLTGLECADTLSRFGVLGTVIELQDRVLKRHVDEAGSAVIHDAMERQGLVIRCGLSVTGFVTDQGKLKAVILSDGQKLETDTLICALGSRPRSSLALAAGLALQDGAIVTNHFLQTSDPAIWAAGDVASIIDRLTDTPIPSATWPDAVQQGMYAAYAMVGQQRVYSGMMPLAYSEFFGGSFHSAGFLEVYDKLGWTAEIDQSEGYAKVIFDQNKVVQGFICFGSPLWNLVAYKRSFISQMPVEL